MHLPEPLGILLAVAVTLAVQKSYFLNAPRGNLFKIYSPQPKLSARGLKMYMLTVLTLRNDQKVFSQPSHYCNFLYQGTNTLIAFAAKTTTHTGLNICT